MTGDPGVRTFRSDRLAEALDGSTAVALAVSSEGFEDVLAAAAPHLGPRKFLALTTKGFAP